MTQTPFEELVFQLTDRYGAPEAGSIARIVLEDEFGAKHVNYWQIPDENAQKRFDFIAQALVAGQPVQYVLGMADFFGLKYKVTPAVLIPRQETEDLVDWILKWLKKEKMPQPQLLDIGLGSGCIGITVKYKQRDVQLTGMEKSPEALAIAAENAQRLLGPDQVDFRLNDILTLEPSAEKWHVIVSNPPYIPRTEAAIMPEHVLAHEPELALFVEDPDALLFYRVIADFAQQHLLEGGALFFECNEFNASEVVEMLQEKGFSEVELRKDISDADRMVMARKG